MPKSDLDILLRDHGGLEGLAHELGQFLVRIEEAEVANENEPPARVWLWFRGMRRWLARLVVGLAMLASLLPPANAEEYKLSVQNLYTDCNAPDRSALWGLCFAYITGVGEMMALVSKLNASHPHNNEAYAPFALCGTPSYAAMVQAFKNWTEKNPREWSEPQFVGVVAALNETWPCPLK